MTNKSIGYKARWLIIGIASGMFVTLFIPEILIRNRLTTHQNSNFHHVVNGYQFTNYSQWPPFLTDPTFDLV